MQKIYIIINKFSTRSIFVFFAIDNHDKLSYDFNMILIRRKIIIVFGKKHPHSRHPLSAWEKAISHTDYRSFNQLKKTFSSVDYVHHHYTIFDISGNKYRLITEIDYAARVINIKCIWTHAEYSMKKNEEALKRGRL